MSEIPSAKDLVKMNEQKANNEYRLASVVSLFSTGHPKIKFDGEESASEKKYSYLASYTPQSGDRVFLVRVSGTYIILGKVKY